MVSPVLEPIIHSAAFSGATGTPAEITQQEATGRGPQSRQALRAGNICPTCREERLDYDGMVNLSCPRCGPVVSGCFT